MLPRRILFKSGIRLFRMVSFNNWFDRKLNGCYLSIPIIPLKSIPLKLIFSVKKYQKYVTIFFLMYLNFFLR